MNVKFRTKIFLAISVILLIGFTAVFFAASPIIKRQISGVIDQQIDHVYNTLEKVQQVSLQSQIFQGSLLSSRRDLEGALLTYYDALNFDPSQFNQNAETQSVSQKQLIQIAVATVSNVVMEMLKRFENRLDLDFILLTDIEGKILHKQGLDIAEESAAGLAF